MEYQNRLHADAEEYADFWANATPEPNTGCWLWHGYMASDQYGLYNKAYTHRVSYQLHVGDIPPKAVVRHKCDTPLCVNPDHLEVGTHYDNAMDAVRRRRHVNTRKTHCAQGHAFDDSNTGFEKRGNRFCKACKVEKNRRYRAKNPASQPKKA